ncbi:SPFH domain-containing protein [Oscillospiraceae bacterium 42-9]
MAFLDVIKYEGSNNVLVWKHPREDFNTNSQLIVHESQEAFLFRDGQILGPYYPGKHNIQTENIPGVRRVVGLFTGGISPNHYEVYYVNKANIMNVCWGTTSPWTIQDQSVQIPFEMQAHGQFAVKVVDSKQFLLKLVGTTTNFSQRTLQDLFYGYMITHIKTQISTLIEAEGLSHAEISSHLLDISEKVKPRLEPNFSKYGLTLEEFVVESIGILKDEIYKGVRSAMLVRAENTITDITTREKMSFDVAKTQAANPGHGGQIGQIVGGVTTGVAMASAMGEITRNIMQPLTTANEDHPQRQDQFSMGMVTGSKLTTESHTIKCQRCGTEVPDSSHFCHMCGEPILLEPPGVTCPNCGSELLPGSIFCNICGNKVSEDKAGH